MLFRTTQLKITPKPSIGHTTNPIDDQTGQNTVPSQAPVHCFNRHNEQIGKIQTVSFLAIFCVRPNMADIP